MPVFYWELPSDEYHRLLASGDGLEEEGLLAIDINYGRRLLAVQCQYQVWPEVAPLPAGLDAPESYSDAIAAILQAAVWEGYDPEDLCGRALTTQRAVVGMSAAAARSRQAAP